MKGESLRGLLARDLGAHGGPWAPRGSPEDLRKRRPGCLVSPREHWGLPGRGFRAGGPLGPSRPGGPPGALRARGSPGPSPSSQSPRGALRIPGPGSGPGSSGQAPGAGGPLGAPRTLGSWAPLGARASIGPRRIRRAPGGPRGTGDPQRPRGGGARKSTRGPLRAPRRPLGAWGLGALSFPPPGAPMAPRSLSSRIPGPSGSQP